ELPQQRRKRFVEAYAIPDYDSTILTSSKALADYFEECVHQYPQPKVVSNWIMSEMLRLLNQDNRDIDQSPVTPAQLAALLMLMEKGTISGKIAKQVFETMYETGASAEEIVARQGLEQVSDTSALRAVIDRVLADNPDSVEKYRQGKTKVFGFFVGQVMKETRGKANPELVNQILQEKLSS
ncbi:MAG TPA: Asp-tRNA(Asn)/Glu-tRNA(Gln) amidotransferase GatCAB subunit B, partial [Thermodesulfobacteriota bacterium]|nr:Asp-tRNA(Asn)/Glu-tRNA(Gln) amidotransferase GatCAB subunit B [Thermodesulfobacteriota bacterium]